MGPAGIISNNRVPSRDPEQLGQEFEHLWWDMQPYWNGLDLPGESVGVDVAVMGAEEQVVVDDYR